MRTKLLIAAAFTGLVAIAGPAQARFFAYGYYGPYRPYYGFYGWPYYRPPVFYAPPPRFYPPPYDYPPPIYEATPAYVRPFSAMPRHPVHRVVHKAAAHATPLRPSPPTPPPPSPSYDVYPPERTGR